MIVQFSTLRGAGWTESGLQGSGTLFLIVVEKDHDLIAHGKHDALQGADNLQNRPTFLSSYKDLSQ